MHGRPILYAARDGSALVSHLALAWGRMQAEIRIVPPAFLHDVAYLSLNPLGTAPLLVLPDGRRLTETEAILWHVHRARPDRFPVPERDPAGEVALVQALVFLGRRVDARFAPLRPSGPIPTEAEIGGAARAEAAHRLVRTAALLNDRIAGPFLFGACPSVADAYLCVMVRWLTEAGLLPTAARRLRALRVRVEAVPEVRRALEAYR